MTDDVDRALGLVMKSVEQVGIDPEAGEFDVDVVETGQSKSQLDRRKLAGLWIDPYLFHRLHHQAQRSVDIVSHLDLVLILFHRRS